MAMYKLDINGQKYSVDVAEDTPLLWVASRSCVLPVSVLSNAKIITIEGLSANGDHPVQKAWDDIDVPQCGYCQAGQIMTAAALLSKTPKPSDKKIIEAMDGHICRCGTYHRILDAVKTASRNMK